MNSTLIKNTLLALLKRAKSRTYWLALVVAVSSQLPLIKDLLAENYGITAMALTVIIAVLREDTNKALKDK